MTPKQLKWTFPTLMDLVLLTAIALSCLPTGQSRNPGVTILSDTGSDILVHCKSADTDIGLKKLPYGQKLHWSFHPNIGLSTLYWCNFAWTNPSTATTLYATFDVWSSKIIRSYLRDSAAWKAEQDGFYIFVSVTGTWEKWEYWSPNRTRSFASDNLN